MGVLAEAELMGGMGKAFRATRAARMFRGQDAWRDHEYVNASNNMKVRHMLPGLTNAAGIFAVYLVLDAAVGAMSASAKHAEEGGKAIAELKKLKKEMGSEDSRGHH